MADRFGYGEIELDIHPCKGCEDYDPPDGCKTHGGCAKPMHNADRWRTQDLNYKPNAWMEASADGRHIVFPVYDVPDVVQEPAEIEVDKYGLGATSYIDGLFPCGYTFYVPYTKQNYRALSKLGEPWHIKIRFSGVNEDTFQFDAETISIAKCPEKIAFPQKYVIEWCVALTSEVTAKWYKNVTRRKINVRREEQS